MSRHVENILGLAYVDEFTVVESPVWPLAELAGVASDSDPHGASFHDSLPSRGRRTWLSSKAPRTAPLEILILRGRE
jgi:hypothetical protein